MVIITCLVFLLVFVTSKTYANKVFTFIVGGYICLFLLLSLFNPFGLYPVGFEAYFMLTTGFSFFLIGLVNQKKYKFCMHPMGLYSFENKLNIILKNKIFWILFFLSFGVIAFLAVTQWRLILVQGGAGNLKIDTFELLFNNNSILFFIYQIIVFPFFYLSCILLVTLLLEKGKIKYILLFSLYVLLFSFVGGKRGYFLIVLEVFVSIFLLIKLKRIRLSFFTWFKYLSIAVVVLLTILLGAAYMTSIGKNGVDADKDNLLSSLEENAKNVVIYNIGPFRAFEYALKHEYLEYAGGYTLGRSTLGGAIDYYGVGVLERLGFPISRVRDKTMSLLQENSIVIGDGVTFNFSYTGLMYFYYDLGFVGIVFFSLLYGLFCSIILNLFNRYRTFGSLCLVAFMIVEGLLFVATWFNISISAQPTIFLFYLLHRYEIKRVKMVKKV